MTKLRAWIVAHEPAWLATKRKSIISGVSAFAVYELARHGLDVTAQIPGVGVPWSTGVSVITGAVVAFLIPNKTPEAPAP